MYSNVFITNKHELYLRLCVLPDKRQKVLFYSCTTYITIGMAHTLCFTKRNTFQLNAQKILYALFDLRCLRFYSTEEMLIKLSFISVKKELNMSHVAIMHVFEDAIEK